MLALLSMSGVSKSFGATRALADVSFLLGRLRGEKMSRIRLIFAPELRPEIIRRLAAD